MSGTHQATFETDGSITTTDWPDVAGIDELRREPTAVEIKWGISKPELERRHHESPPVRTDRERFCTECRKRVTETPSGVEAGHASGRKNDKCSKYPDFEGERDVTFWRGDDV